MNYNKSPQPHTIEIKNIHEIEQIALMISKIDRYRRLEGKGIELKEILSICAKVWEEPEDTIKQRIQHNKYKVLRMQYSFLWAAGYYCNCNSSEIADYMHCQTKTFYYGIELMNSRIESKDMEYPKLLEIIEACERRCPGRIKSNFKLGLDYDEMYVGKEDSEPFRLTQYQINAIPTKELTWFIENGRDSIYAYRVGENLCRYIVARTKGQAEHLFMLQSFGFRFTGSSKKERERIEKRHPICDKCAKKMDCPLRGRGYSVFFERGKDQFSCFTPLKDIEMKIDIELLYSLEKYRLQ